MRTATLEYVLNAARDCLASVKLMSGVRSIVTEYTSDYENCIDRSLSQQLELLSGLMVEYTRWQKEYIPLDFGEAPVSYKDAIRTLDHFVDKAVEAVKTTLDNPTFMFPADEIGVRAQTLSSVLRAKEDTNSG